MLGSVNFQEKKIIEFKEIVGETCSYLLNVKVSRATEQTESTL